MDTVQDLSVDPNNAPDPNSAPAQDLKHLFLLVRHGKRAPMSLPAKFVSSSVDDWPAGLGNLTTDGRLQMFEIGQHFRKLYSSYLTHDPREVFAMSKKASRCFDSAACFLAGMYPPKQDWIWNEDVPWQPIQIHTEQVPPTPVFDLTEEEAKMLQRQPGFGPFSTARDFLHELVSRYGCGTYNLSSAECILHNFACRKIRGYSVCDWAESNWGVLTWALDQCHDFRCNVMKAYYARDSFSVLKKILRDKFVERNKGYMKKKITIYCLSDINITGIFKILGSDITKMPPFGATLAIEVFGSEDDPQIRILYIPDIEKEPQLIRFSRCSNPCSLSEFMKVIELKEDKVMH